MNIQLEPIGPQHSHLLVSLAPADYQPQIETKLKTLRKTARLKGFRQGAAPESMIRKLYEEEIKAELIQKLLNQSIQDYQKSEQLDFLGDLMDVPGHAISEDQEHYTFKFEVGLAPQIHADEILEKLTVSRFKILASENEINEEVKKFRHQYGEQLEVESPAIEADILNLDVKEMDQDQVKENGWTSSFSIILDDVLVDDLKNELIGKSKGDSFVFDIHHVEKELDEKSIRQYLLKIPADQDEQIVVNSIFQGTINSIKRKVPAELNEELLVKVFGPDTEIRNESLLKEYFSNEIEKYLEVESHKLLDIELVKEIVTAAHLTFPEDFMLRWLKKTYPEWNEKTDHEIAHDFLHFKESMSWRLIRDYLIKNRSIEIKYSDIIDSVIDEIQQRYPLGNLAPEMREQLAKRFLDTEEKVMKYMSETSTRKTLEWIKNHITIPVNEVDMQAFKDRVKHVTSHHH